MKKIALAKSWKGFVLSDEAKAWLLERNFRAEYKAERNCPEYQWEDEDMFCDVEWGREIDLRTDPLLIECIETLGKRVNKDEEVNIGIAEFDDENFYPNINPYSDYNDKEYLSYQPLVNKSKIKQCANTEEICDYLESLRIRVNRN